MKRTKKIGQRSKAMGLAVLLMTSALVPDAFAHVGTSGTIQNIAQKIQTPRSLEKFMKKDLRYVSDRTQFGKDEHWQTPEEMLSNKKGDCEDYALFAQEILKRMGYRTLILSVYWNRDAHTVVAFESEGRWNLFNLSELREIKADSLQMLANAVERDWSYLGIMRQEGAGGIIARKVQRQSDLISPGLIPGLQLFSGLQNTSGARATSFEPLAAGNQAASSPS